MQPITWSTLALMLTAGMSAVAYFNYQRAQKEMAGVGTVESVGKALLGGPWELVNTDGEPVTDASYRGEYILLYFGFTFCPDICPSELAKLGKALDLLGACH